MYLLILALGLVVGYMFLFVRSLNGPGGYKSFECGIRRLMVKGSYFSLRFFILCLLFLLIDLELVLLVYRPILVSVKVECIVVFSLILWVFVLGTI